MTASEPSKTRVQPRSLFGVMKFLRRYRLPAALAISLLFVNITIEMTLPQILASAITQLRESTAGASEFSLGDYVRAFVALVLIRAGVGFILGPIRNRVIQRTPGDIR